MPCKRLCRNWCHLAIGTQGHASYSKSSKSASKPLHRQPGVAWIPNASSRIQNHSAASNSWRLAPVTGIPPAVSSSLVNFQPFSAVCLAMFLLEFRPQTFTIDPLWKKPTRSGIMIFEYSCPLKYYFGQSVDAYVPQLNKTQLLLDVCDSASWLQFRNKPHFAYA